MYDYEWDYDTDLFKVFNRSNRVRAVAICEELENAEKIVKGLNAPSWEDNAPSWENLFEMGN